MSFEKDLLLLTQNCRGLNNRAKLQHIMTNKNKLVKGKRFVLALQETYLVEENTVMRYGNYAFTKAESNHSAGCITFFPETVKIIEKIDIDDQGHGHVVAVEGLGAKPTILCNIYAPVRSMNNAQAEFYAKLSSIIDELESKYILHEPELILMGDFNLPLESELNLNPVERVRAQNLTELFSSLGLIDCWKNNDDRVTHRGGNSRLDRILYRMHGNIDDSLSTDWTFTTSDHCLLIVEIKKEQPRSHRNSRIIALPTYILQLQEDRQYIYNGLNDFKNMINEEWSGQMKLEYLKMGLRTVVGECIKNRSKKEREELDSIQKELEKRMVRRRTIPLRGIEANKVEIDLLFAKRNEILESRCESLAIKSKTKWYYEGEKSNKYFLNLLRKRTALCEITSIETEAGIINDESQIKMEIRNFYVDLYENGMVSEIDDNFYEFCEKVDPEVSDTLISSITKEELYSTLKTCTDSAPGPDGISYSFYRYYWNFFGDILVLAWNESLLNGILPASHRNSLLRLLPKQGKDLSKIANWRPITLSNCDHKIITKCYAKRLTRAIQDKLHSSQTAYLPGKQIQDNLRLINIINKTADNPIIAALDAKKAFDSVSHEYIRKTLEAYGLEKFIPIFELLYKDQRVDIALNSDVINGYVIKNGVKQGDSLSCILFIMCMDPLIRNIENNTNIERVEMVDYVPPKVIAYADDVTCFVDSKRSLRYVFKEYERLSKASGLILNADKTEILDRMSLTYSFKYMNE
jgi:hypothetical protein